MAKNDNFELANLKGTGDFLPAQMLVRNRVTSILRGTFERYGYLPLETSTLCLFELLSYKYAGGAEILKEVYKLSDQGERELGLRYDLTVPFAKVIGLNQNLRMPFRRYEIGKVYRDGPVKLGRAREFYQCDIDVVGLDGQAIEAEFFKLAVDAFREIGIEPIIEYNNRKFLSGVILESGVAEENVAGVILKVDALKKHGEQYVREEIAKDKLAEASAVDKLFENLNLPVERLLEKFASADGLIREGIDELAKLQAYITALGVSDSCRFVSGLARGLEIYTGTVWEVYDRQERLSSALGGGGRYDKIITQFMDNGTVYPAVGMSFGLEPICALLSKDGEEQPSPIELYICPMNTMSEALSLATELRAMGLSVLVDMTGAKLKKSLTYANNERINHVIVLGENEVQSGEFELKNMLDRTANIMVKRDDLEPIKAAIRG